VGKRRNCVNIANKINDCFMLKMEMIKKRSPTLGLGDMGLEVRVWIRVWIRINVWINCRSITTQYFIAFNGIATPIDYWSLCEMAAGCPFSECFSL
jgi:hypothetical protein